MSSVDAASKSYRCDWISTDICFNTRSDAKLARLYLDGDLSIAAFKRVLDLFHDPDFNSNDVTFKSVWNMLDYISGQRRLRAEKREIVEMPIRSTTESHQVSRLSGVIPPIILSVVIDLLVEDRLPLGVAAMERYWEDAFINNGITFWTMSVVHRSWTLTAQKGLRRRAVVPYHRIDKFLLSPLCGPWITEMIIYWTVDEMRGGDTEDQMWALRALLRRTANLKSLSYNSSLSAIGDRLYPSFDAGYCIESIATLLPNLENLWLKHFDCGENSLSVCDDLHDLCLSIPNMRSLKFLSIRSWRIGQERLEWGQERLKWDEHPPPNLKEIEFVVTDSRQDNMDTLRWFLKSRGNFSVHSLSIIVEDEMFKWWRSQELRDFFYDCLHAVRELRLCISDGSKRWAMFNDDDDDDIPPYVRLLAASNNLVRLDLFIIPQGRIYSYSGPTDHFDLGRIGFPPSLETLGIHYFDKTFKQSLSASSDAGKQFLQDMKKQILSSPRLRSLLITGSSELTDDEIGVMGMDGIIHHMDESAERLKSGISEMLVELCRERGVELTCLDNAFHRPWNNDTLR